MRWPMEQCLLLSPNCPLERPLFGRLNVGLHEPGPSHGWIIPDNNAWLNGLIFQSLMSIWQVVYSTYGGII